ncbi:hypothetical protein OK016_24305 [Vibrio chagasii]|nr:hypothetical protein [Vibrio chagasii]
MYQTSESQSFVMTMVQSLQFGSSVSPVLATPATDIRELNMMDLEERIGKMGGKNVHPSDRFYHGSYCCSLLLPQVF